MGDRLGQAVGFRILDAQAHLQYLSSRKKAFCLDFYKGIWPISSIKNNDR
jgi:hypothetical protein